MNGSNLRFVTSEMPSPNISALLIAGWKPLAINPAKATVATVTPATIGLLITVATFTNAPTAVALAENLSTNPANPPMIALTPVTIDAILNPAHIVPATRATVLIIGMSFSKFSFACDT